MCCGFGQYSGQTAAADQFQQNVDFIEFDTHTHINAFRSNHCIKIVSRLQAAGRQCKIIFRKLGKRDFLLRCQGMATVDHHCKKILKQTVGFDTGQRLLRFECKHKVNFTFNKHVHQLGHRLIKNIELHSRIKFHEIKQRLCQYGAERICHPDVESACKQFAQIIHALKTEL